MGLLIGDVARRSGLSASALRYYERIGLIATTARVSKRRIYDRAVLGRIRIILLAREAGLTLKETKTFLGNYPEGTTPANRWRKLAAKKLVELDAQMMRLARMKSILNESFRCGCSQLEDCERLMQPPDKTSA